MDPCSISCWVIIVNSLKNACSNIGRVDVGPNNTNLTMQFSAPSNASAEGEKVNNRASSKQIPLKDNLTVLNIRILRDYT